MLIRLCYSPECQVDGAWPLELAVLGGHLWEMDLSVVGGPTASGPNVPGPSLAFQGL